MEKRPIPPPTENAQPHAAVKSPRGPLRSAILAFLRFAFGVAILAYLWKSGAIHFRELEKLAAQWPVTIAAVAVLFIDVVLMALRTSLLLRPHGLHLPVSTSIRLTLVSSWFATFSPGASGGDIAKVFYATRQNDGRRTEVAVVLLLDRAVGLLSMLLIPLLLTPWFLEALRAARPLRELLAATAAVAALAVVGLLVCIFNESFRRSVATKNPAAGSMRDRVSRALATLAAYRHHTSTLLLSLLIALLDNLLVIVVSALGLFVLNPAVLSAKLCLVVPLGTVANSLPLTPGGLGVGEAAFNKVFALAGLALGAETLVCSRIWKLIAAVPGLLIYFRGVGPISLRKENTPGQRSASR